MKNTSSGWNTAKKNELDKFISTRRIEELKTRRDCFDPYFVSFVFKITASSKQSLKKQRKLGEQYIPALWTGFYAVAANKFATAEKPSPRSGRYRPPSNYLCAL